MPGIAKPTKLTLRVYQVGFGDCFLLTFHYASSERHILIDFGSTGMPARSRLSMEDIAKDIENECGGKLHAVVATHRHKDHISGFAKELTFLGEDNLSNLPAVENLMTMGKNHYVHYGTSSGLEKVLPGVQIRVLGRD